MAVSRIRRRPESSAAGDPETRIAALMDAHGAALLRTARHYSLCADDAHDAMQRALEIYLRKLDDDEVATEAAWLKVVVRHEAMAVRRLRSESVGSDDVDFDTRADEDLRPVEDRLFGAERSARSAEALRRLKPDEAKALMLKAEGLSYAEIGARHSWSHTKTNRAITEGRRRFLKVYAELEAKDACEPFGSALSELARGTASAETIMALRPHLRHCSACRATVREMRGGRRRVAAWLPLPVAVWLSGRHGRVLDRDTNAAEAGFAAASPDERLPAIDPGRWAELKLHFNNLLHRFTSSDVATSAQIASASGGGRTASVAALIGFCISSVGAGTYCVATLVLPSEPPKPVVRKAEKRPERRTPVRPDQDRPVETVTARQPVVVATSTPTPAPRRKRRTAPRSSSATAGAGLTSQEASPPPVPAARGQQEFSFESSAPSGSGASPSSSTPAAAPATGGGEFSP